MSSLQSPNSPLAVEARQSPFDEPIEKVAEKKTKRIYQCDHENCGKVFTRLYSLKRHKMCHEKIRRFACTLCDKKFALPQYLKEHMLTHTGQKPFVCTHPGCNKRFRQAGKLSIHKKVHRLEEEQKKQNEKKQHHCQADKMDVDADGLDKNVNIKMKLGEYPFGAFVDSSPSSVSTCHSSCRHEHAPKPQQLKSWADCGPSSSPSFEPSVALEVESSVFQFEQQKSFIELRRLPIPEKMLRKLEEDGVHIQKILDERFTRKAAAGNRPYDLPLSDFFATTNSALSSVINSNSYKRHL